MSAITEEEENGVRLHLLLEICNEALLKIFYRSFSSSPFTLYVELKSRQSDLSRLRNKKILNAEQWNRLFPINKMTESKYFDISLLFQLIRTLCNISNDDKFWRNEPNANDFSEHACILRIKNQRNILLHNTLRISHSEFATIWNELSTCLISLAFHTQTDIDKIKDIVLDLKILKQLKIVEKNLANEKSINQSLKEDMKNLKSRLDGVRWKISPNVNNFAGRDEDVERIHNIVSAENRSCFGASLTGIGGVGKTELAKYYCNKYGTSYYTDNVIWIEADDTGILESSFFRVADFLDIPTQDAYGNVADVSSVITKVYNFFADRKTLFVFDNLQWISNLIDYLPTSFPSNVSGPTILITSQFQNWSLNFDKIEIREFSDSNAELFMRTNLPDTKIEPNDCKCLSELTGNLPLALQQAISYIKRHHISISKYVELFQENYKSVLKSENNLFYKHTVLTTWKMALDKLEETKNQVAMDIIFLISYANGKGINKDILFGMKAKVSETDINEALDDLSSYSLISIQYKEAYSCISIHSLIQLVVRETAQIGITNEFLLLLKKQIKLSQFDKFNFGDVWLQHMINAFKTCTMDKELMSTFLQLRIHIKQALMNKGKYTLCHTLFSRMFEEMSPLIDSLTSYARHDLRSDIANNLIYCGKFDQAKKIYEDMIKEQHVRIRGKYSTNCEVVNNEKLESPLILRNKQTSTRNSALINAYPEDIDEVQGYSSESSCSSRFYCRENSNSSLENSGFYESVLKRTQTLSRNAPIILISYLRNKALCSLYQGKYNECSKLLKSVKAFILSFYGVQHPSLNDIDHLLALCLMKTGKYKEALHLFHVVEEEIDATSLSTFHRKKNEVYDIMGQEGMLPHPITIHSHIAKCLFKCKKYKKSLKLFKEVETRRIKLLGNNHPLALQDRCNTATCIAQRFNSMEGIRILREVEKKQIEIFDGTLHPQLLVTQYNIARVLLKRDCVKEALEQYRRIYKNQCDIYGETHLKATATWKDIQYCESRTCCCCRFGKKFDARISIVEFN